MISFRPNIFASLCILDVLRYIINALSYNACVLLCIVNVSSYNACASINNLDASHRIRKSSGSNRVVIAWSQNAIAHHRKQAASKTPDLESLPIIFDNTVLSNFALVQAFGLCTPALHQRSRLKRYSTAR